MVSCVAFSNTAEVGDRFASIRIESRCTEIMAGLQAFATSLASSPCDRVILVFISDGEDNHPKTILERINGMPPLPVKECVVVTVAVGRFGNFPVDVAITLRDKFHTDNSVRGDGRPFVIETSPDEEEACLAMEEVAAFVDDVLNHGEVGPLRPLFNRADLIIACPGRTLCSASPPTCRRRRCCGWSRPSTAAEPSSASASSGSPTRRTPRP